MEIESLREFYDTYIKLVEAVTSEENKLRGRERDFLVQCCLYNANGGDLNNFKELSNHFLDINFFSRRQDVSTYKYKLSLKNWVISERENFEIPGVLGKKDLDDLKFSISIKYKNELDEVSDR